VLFIMVMVVLCSRAVDMNFHRSIVNQFTYPVNVLASVHYITLRSPSPNDLFVLT